MAINPEVVRRGRLTGLIVHPQGRELVFVHPPQGPHDYQTVGRGILARSLSLATGEETAYLLQGAFESNEPEFKEATYPLWVFNDCLWVPEGVYVVHDPNASGLSKYLIEDELEARLSNGYELNGIRFSQDDSVRFAPRETYRLGQHTPESLAEDGFVIAGHKVEGAKALGEVAEKILHDGGFAPVTFCADVNKGARPVQRVSSLDSDWDFDGHRLDVDGDDHGDRNGCAFGVLRRADEASRKNEGR